MTEKIRPLLPPPWCSAICRNAMNEICIESCNPKGDCSGFEVKPNLTLDDMPPFPETKDMSKEEKFTSVTIYLSKVVDHLQGIEDEPAYLPFLQTLPVVDKMKSIMKVAASIPASQENTADVEVVNETQQSSEGSDSLFGSETPSSNEDE